MVALEEGQRFERYRVLHWLGRGVSGESYEAEDSVLQRKVTLKLIHPWSMLPDAARRQFFREVQGMSILTHPYLAATLDYGEIDGQLYIARRFVSPGSLLGSEGRTWYRPPLEVADAIHYTHQLAQALHHVHSYGYAHGSLTFANLLVLRGPNLDNEPDFAPFLIADVGTTHFVRRFGQPRTMPLPITTAPEQLGKRLVPASDQYALAVLLYLWLAGHPPFLGSPEEIEQLKLSEIIPPLATPQSGITSQQERIIRRALSVYPDERYPSILDFSGELLATLQPPTLSLPVTPLPATPIQPIQSPQEPEPAPRPATRPLEAVVAHEPAPPPPQVIPDVPQPLPGRVPEPVPVPAPPAAPEPVPLPEPEPEVLPTPGPDIAQPFPEPSSPPDEPALEAVPPHLIITSPFSDTAQEIYLERRETTIGHAGSSDILLNQGILTSRHHALLKRDGDYYYIYDSRSTQGVFVNGQQIPCEIEYALSDGDQIGIGEYTLHFHFKQAQPQNAGTAFMLS